MRHFSVGASTSTTATGGEASLVGYSSGAALVLRVAASGLPVRKVVAYEPPFVGDHIIWVILARPVELEGANQLTFDIRLATPRYVPSG